MPPNHISTQTTGLCQCFEGRAPTGDGSELKPNLTLLNSCMEMALKIIFGGLDSN